MSREPNNNAGKDMRQAVRLRQDRRERLRKEGEQPFWQSLSIIGTLGWLIVTPTFLGVLAGRWLDKLFDTGVFFSGTLIFAGASLGFYLAWNRMNSK